MKKYDEEFEQWFDGINSHYGLLGTGKKDAESYFYGKFMAYFRCFHACLKLYNCCGDMFGNFLAIFFGAWRDSSAKVLYILNPSDPTQLEGEQPQYTSLLITSLRTSIANRALVMMSHRRQMSTDI